MFSKTVSLFESANVTNKYMIHHELHKYRSKDNMTMSFNTQA